MSFAFGMNYKNISDIARKMALLTSEANQEIMSRITGARFDMEFSPMSRHLQTFGQRGAEADVVTVAESARDDFLRRLPRVKAPLSSVTALELYLEIAEHSSQLLYPNIAAFVRNNLPNLSDLYVECSSRTFGKPWGLHIALTSTC